MSTPTVGRSVLLMLLTRAAILPLGLLYGALLARQLGPEGLGRYSAMLVDANLLVAVASLGLPGALSVLLGEERGRLRPLLGIALRHGVLLLLLPAAVLLALALGRPALLRAVDRLPGEAALILVLCACLYLRDVLGALLLGGQQFSAQNRQALGYTGFQIALLLGLLWFGALTPRTALGLQIVSVLLLCATSAIALRRAAAPPAPAEPDLGRRARRIGVRNFLHLIPDLLLMRIDVYLLQGLLARGAAQTELGLYQAGVRVAELVLMVPGALNAVLFAKAAAREDLTRVTIAGAKLSLYLGLAAALAMALVGQPLLVLLYGQRFAGSFWPCLLVLVGCAALCFSGPLGGTLAGAGAYPRSVIAAQALSLICNVGANLHLIPRQGAVGAGAASALAYSVSAAVIAVGFCRRFGVPMPALLVPESPLRLIEEVRRS